MSLSLGLVACGDDDDGGTTPDAASTTPDAAGPDAGPGDYVPLITGTWSIPPGQEIYHCARVTVAQDMWITEFKPIIPLGTHHTVLTIDNAGVKADGEYPCTFVENGNKRGLYGTGVGANSLIMPDGVAMKVSAGEQLVLNLHLYNTGDATLTGESGMEVRTIPQAEVVNEADSDLVGKIAGLTVVPGMSTQVANCTVSAAVTLFAFSPHMHQMGSHSKLVVHKGGMDVMLHDAAYDFEEQTVFLIPGMLSLAAGDTMTMDCGYNNQTGVTVGFGDSSNEEMCFIGLYRFPAGAGGINCQ